MWPGPLVYRSRTNTIHISGVEEVRQEQCLGVVGGVIVWQGAGESLWGHDLDAGYTVCPAGLCQLG